MRSLQLQRLVASSSPTLHRAWLVSYRWPAPAITHSHITISPERAQSITRGKGSLKWESELGHRPWQCTSRAFTVISTLKFPAVPSASDFLLHQPPGTGTLSAHSLHGLFSDGLQQGLLTPSETFSCASFIAVEAWSVFQELQFRNSAPEGSWPQKQRKEPSLDITFL